MRNSVTDLIDLIFTEFRPELIKVEHFADTVIVKRNDLEDAHIEKCASESDALWKAYSEGHYICGMETAQDAFRLIRYQRESKQAIAA